MKKKPKAPETVKEKPKPHTVWRCETCEGRPEIPFDQLLAHLRSHGINEEKIMGERSLRTHIDGRDTYQYVFEWKIGDVRLTQREYGVREHDARVAVGQTIW